MRQTRLGGPKRQSRFARSRQLALCSATQGRSSKRARSGNLHSGLQAASKFSPNKEISLPTFPSGKVFSTHTGRHPRGRHVPSTLLGGKTEPSQPRGPRGNTLHSQGQIPEGRRP